MKTYTNAEMSMIIRGHESRLNEHEHRLDDLTGRVVSLQENSALMIKNFKSLFKSKGTDWEWRELTEDELDELHGA